MLAAGNCSNVYDCTCRIFLLLEIW